MPREPVIHMDLIDGLIELSGYVENSSGEEKSPLRVKFQAREKNQRDWMREVAQELGFDREACIQRYAVLDEQGIAPRKRRTMPSEDYAAALWQDGVKKGWLTQRSETRQRKLRIELSQVTGGVSQAATREELAEISKVENRLRLWVNSQHQINAQILNAFLVIERTGAVVSEADIKRQLDSGIDFNSHFVQMRVIAQRNHGKVFDLERGAVTIWPRVEHAVRKYEREVFGK